MSEEILVLKMNVNSFEVYGHSVPEEYLEDHHVLFQVFRNLITGGWNKFFGDEDFISIKCSNNKRFNLSIEEQEFLSLGENEIKIKGKVMDRTDPKQHAIRVYGAWKKFVTIRKSILAKKQVDK